LRICQKCLRQCFKFTPRGICTDCYDKDEQWKRKHPKADPDKVSLKDLKKKWERK